MSDIEGKTKTKRLSKSQSTHQRRLKQAARKPGGAIAIQMARVKAAGEATNKKATQKPLPESLPGGQPDD